MLMVSNLVFALARILNIALSLYLWILIARAVVSWVNADPYNPIVRFLIAVTEPVLGRLRSWLPLAMGGIDFSPMVVILAIVFLKSFLIRTLIQVAVNIR